MHRKNSLATGKTRLLAFECLQLLYIIAIPLYGNGVSIKILVFQNVLSGVPCLFVATKADRPVVEQVSTLLGCLFGLAVR